MGVFDLLEYRLVIQNGNAKPYSLSTFDNFYDCYCQLLSMISMQSRWIHNEYYVLNDFYKNEYPPFLKDIRKYKIEVREVGTWRIYSSKDKKRNNEKVGDLF